MRIVSSAKISEKHQEVFRKAYPTIDFGFYAALEEIARPENVDVLLTYGEDLDEASLDRFVKLRWIQVLSSGVDRLPHDALARRGTIVTNVRGIHAVPMSEYVVGVLLTHVRRLPRFWELKRARVWDRSVRIEELSGKTVLIVGAGAVGRAIAERLLPFGVRILGVNTDGRPVYAFERMYPITALDEALGEADFAVVVLPLTPETRGLFDARRFAAMKPGAVFVNVGRGEVVDEAALVAALEQGVLSAAYLDVFQAEPLPPDHPLWTMPNVEITPHMSGRSPYYMSRALEIFRHNLDRYLAGEVDRMINPVDLRRRY